MRRSLFIAITVAFLAQHVAAQDTASTYDAAIAARLAGQPAEAVRLLKPLVASQPENIDARVQLAYAYLALNRLQKADELFLAVLARAPQYVDAREGLEIIRRRRSAGREDRATIRIEGSVSDLTGGRSNWREFSAAASIPLAQRDTLALSGAHYIRFGLEDTELAASYTMRAGDDLWLRGGTSATPSADFRPSVALSGGVDWRIATGQEATVVGFETIWRTFPLQDVWSFIPSATQYFANGKASVTARAEAIAAQRDRLRVGGLVRGDLHFQRDGRLFFGAATGPDTDFGIVSNRTGVFGGFELPVSSNLFLTGSMGQDWRDGISDRTEVRMGLKARL